MKTILSAAFLLSVVALGPAWAGEAATADAPAVATGAEASGAEPGLTTESPAGNAVAPEADAAKDAPRAEQQAQLVEGAPLGNANVYVHIVQKKPYINEGRHEVVLYPAVLQLNGKFTQHYGVGLMYAYHLFENLAIQLTPVFNYWNQESDFNQELIEKGHQQAQAATALLLQYGGVAGVEVTPMYGKFAFFEGTLGHFTFVVNAGAGVGNTRIQLRPQQTSNCGPGTDQGDCREASFADTGLKLVGSVGAGFRIFLGERAAIRLEVRDFLYTARVDKINGCTYQDLYNLGNRGQPENASCPADTGGFASPDDRQLAMSLLKETSSDVINNMSFYAGFSFLF
ncbi:MAG: outer membrane beta-barrel domain-containing protein [Deltaproteobacteria bacterium]|nr:outer membrane beta-barrel domain-containing protein [Deltaproteobacteria bacterium]